VLYNFGSVPKPLAAISDSGYFLVKFAAYTEYKDAESYYKSLAPDKLTWIFVNVFGVLS
jgi:hypothetical protein